MTNVFSLDRPVYGIAQAAQLLGLRPDRARAWLDGYTRSGTHYPPVVRDVTTKSDLVTWGEVVELGYLRGYRQAAVALQRIRPVIARLRKQYHTPYPLAHYGPWVYDKELVLEAQEAEGASVLARDRRSNRIRHHAVRCREGLHATRRVRR